MPHTEEFKSHMLYLSHAYEVPNSSWDWAGEIKSKRGDRIWSLIGKEDFTRKKARADHDYYVGADPDDLIDNTLDPQAHEEKRELITGPVDELVAISVDMKNPSTVLELEKNLTDETR